MRVLNNSREELEGGVRCEVLGVRDDVLTDCNRRGCDGVLQRALLIQRGLDEVGCQCGILGLRSNGEDPATGESGESGCLSLLGRHLCEADGFLPFCPLCRVLHPDVGQPGAVDIDGELALGKEFGGHTGSNSLIQCDVVGGSEAL